MWDFSQGAKSLLYYIIPVNGRLFFVSLPPGTMGWSVTVAFPYYCKFGNFREGFIFAKLRVS